MAATALIKFVQGTTVGPDGEAIVGVDGTAVNVLNSSNVNVQSWEIDLVNTPPGSTVPVQVPLAFDNNNDTPSATFTPDVRGSYRIQLKVWSVPNRAGTPNIDIRNFCVPDATGHILPPYQKDPDPLPTTASGLPGAKPNEMNINGEEFGWAGAGGEGLFADFFDHASKNPLPAVTQPGDVLQLNALLQPIFGPVPTALAINSFARVGTTLHRVGDTVTNPAFTATYNQLPGSVSVQDNQGNPSQALTTPFASFSYLHSYTKNAVATVTYTLTASKTPGGTATRTATDSWGFDVYHGAAASVTTSSDIQALAVDVVSTSRIVPNYAATATGSNYEWFCIPSSYGTPSFTDVTTGFSIPFDLTGSVSVTNTNGITTTYNIYRSHFSGIGTAGTVVIKVT
jgi:hypothetical protein